jgi:hypothetical protein
MPRSTNFHQLRVFSLVHTNINEQYPMVCLGELTSVLEMTPYNVYPKCNFHIFYLVFLLVVTPLPYFSCKISLKVQSLGVHILDAITNLHV